MEIEGTSGEGSKLVRAFRPSAKRLFDPLKAALLALPPPDAEEAEAEEEDGGEEDAEARAVRRALLRVYSAPERFPQLYTYAKALELLETGACARLGKGKGQRGTVPMRGGRLADPGNDRLIHKSTPTPT